MAWNGSTNVGGTTPAPKKPTKKSPGLAHGLIAGAAIVLIGIISLYFVTSEPDEQPVEKKAPTQIAEAEADIAAPKVAPAKKELTKDELRLNEIAEIEAKYAGKEMPVGIATHLYYLKNPPKISIKHVGPYDVFKHSSERSIASLVLAEPGTEFLDQLEFGARFDQDFVNALLEKNELEEGDDEQTANMKKSVDEAKKEISRICREEGKKPSEVLTEYAKMMFDLGKFERNLREMISEKRNNPELTDDEVKDFISAANAMREERGLEPIEVPSLANRGLMLAHRAARLKAQEEAGGNLESSDK